jgi:hypothetical protein
MLSRTTAYSLLSGLSLVIVLPVNGLAQLTIQQPVFGVNSVTTTVSVPDRGRAHLGSISRARDSRTHFGPFRPGTSTGLDREHSSMSVGVYIHDFEAMDQYLLNQGTPTSSRLPQLSGGALHAWGQLQAHHGRASVPSLPDTAKASKSDKYWQLGQKAEREGNVAVARLHYRVASRHGSKAAQDRLDAWDAASSPTQIAGARR